VLPSTPFAPSTSLGKVVPLIGYPAVEVGTPWVEADGAYTGECSTEGGANVLRIAGATPDAPQLRALPDAGWGLHLTDANIALGDLVALAARQAAAWRRR